MSTRCTFPSQAAMCDPVMAADGHSYERAALQGALHLLRLCSPLNKAHAADGRPEWHDAAVLFDQCRYGEMVIIEARLCFFPKQGVLLESSERTHNQVNWDQTPRTFRDQIVLSRM